MQPRSAQPSLNESCLFQAFQQRLNFVTFFKSEVQSNIGDHGSHNFFMHKKMKSFLLSC